MENTDEKEINPGAGIYKSIYDCGYNTSMATIQQSQPAQTTPVEPKSNKDIWWKIVAAIIIILLLLLGGFWAGRKSVKTKTETIIEYIQLPPIHDTITQFRFRYIPADTASIIQTCVEKGLFAELFPWKTDTVFTKEDTTLIIGDWASRREYAETLFDVDTLGKLDVKIGVQYNRLDTLEYEYTPGQKQTTTTITKEHVFEPFVGAGLTVGAGKQVNFAPSLEVGAYIKQHYGVGLQYQYLLPESNHEVTAKFLYKF